MVRNQKCIISCAITGNAPFNRSHPSFPISPEQIASSCLEAAKAGAAIVHIHVRDPVTGEGSREPHLFKEVVDRVRDANSDVLINLTGGLGAFFLPDPSDESRAMPRSDVATVDQRMRHLELCRPDIASLDINTRNQTEGPLEFVYMNTTRTLREMARRYQELKIKPELEVFSAGDIEFGKSLVAQGLIDGPPMFQFVLGVKWQAPADTLTVYYMRQLLPAEAVERGKVGSYALRVTIGLPREDHGHRSSSWSFHARHSRSVRISWRRRQTDYSSRLHGHATFSGGGQLGTMGSMSHVLAQQFSPACSISAPAASPTVHGPIGQT